MENARVIIIEDDSRFRDIWRLNLEIMGHTIAGEAASVAEAEGLIQSLNPTLVDIAMLDGNLSKPSAGGLDGERLASLIHERLPGVLVVGCSLDGEVRGADTNISKGDTQALTTLVAEFERG